MEYRERVQRRADGRHVQGWCSSDRCRAGARVAIALGLGVLLLAGPGEVAFAKADDPSNATFVFQELNDSGIAGGASLTAKGSRTVVTILVDGALGDHPTHIHEGTCDDLDPNPQFPLDNVRLKPASLLGESVTTVDVSLGELLADPHLILIHKSSRQIGTYYACGDIVPGTLSADRAIAGQPADPLPSTGVGPSPGRGTPTNGWFTVVATLAACVLAVGSLALGKDRVPSCASD